MSDRIYITLLGLSALGFALFFTATVIPPLIDNFDPVGAALAGFVNPFAAGYSTDVLICWAVLAIFVIQDARSHNIRHGWIALLLGVVPGVATGFAIYLIMRHRQLVKS